MTTGYAEVNGAKLYYELAGEGQPFIMIHAGVADSRQWNNEFTYFSKHYQVLRFDMREFGKSVPVAGEFNIQGDFEGLLDVLGIDAPIVLMGCSMGGGLAIDFALTSPERVSALILVGSGPAGLELDTDDPEDLFTQAEKAFEANDLDLAAEIEAQIWFDGVGRTKDDVNPTQRQLAIDMNRIALGHDAKKLGKHVRKQFDKPPFERLVELTMPTFIVIGANDIPYILAAADYMVENLPSASKVVIPNAAHLPNMEHPEIFQEAIVDFLSSTHIV